MLPGTGEQLPPFPLLLGVPLNLNFFFVLFCFLCDVPGVAILELNSVDEACLELGDPPASASVSHVLGLKACATIA